MDWQDQLAQHEAKSQRLRAFDAGIEAKLTATLGPLWDLASAEQQKEVLTQRQRDWQHLRFFFEAAIVCNADLFGYLGMIYSNPDAFRAIGATKTLEAAESLRCLFEEQQSLGSDEEKDAFWLRTEKQRLPIERTAEDMMEFADLLIRFAEAHPNEFPPAAPGDPFEKLSEHMNALLQRAKGQHNGS